MAIALGAVLNLMADFAGDFQAAKGLLDRKDYQAAHQVFAELATAAPNAHGEAMCLSYAAIALGQLKQVDPALELAQTIETAPISVCTQMEIMAANRQHEKLIAAFKEEDIAAWPDRINYRGFFLRGTAYSLSGDKQAALKDFEHCVELAGSDTWVRLEALDSLAAVCHTLADDARAMDVYREAFAIYDESPNRKGRWLYPKALLGAAGIMMSQGQCGKAEAILAGFSDWPHKNTRGPWDFLVLEAYGDIALAQGKREEALARYRDAVTIDTHGSYIERVKAKIEALAKERQ